MLRQRPHRPGKLKPWTMAVYMIADGINGSSALDASAEQAQDDIKAALAAAGANGTVNVAMQMDFKETPGTRRLIVHRHRDWIRSRPRRGSGRSARARAVFSLGAQRVSGRALRRALLGAQQRTGWVVFRAVAARRPASRSDASRAGLRVRALNADTRQARRYRAVQGLLDVDARGGMRAEGRREVHGLLAIDGSR